MLKEAFGNQIGMFLWRAGLLAAIVAAIGFAGIQLRGAVFGGSQAQTPSTSGGVIAQNTTGPIINNQGIITQGQTGGMNVVVPKPAPRSIDQHFKDFVREHFQDKSKEMIPMVLTGDDAGERTDFANQIIGFLKSDGYTVGQMTYYIEAGPPTKGVIFDPYSDPKVIKIRIGINDRQP